jgi:hypothetical protein
MLPDGGPADKLIGAITGIDEKGWEHPPSLKLRRAGT